MENKAGQFKIYGQGELDPGRTMKICLKLEISQMGSIVDVVLYCSLYLFSCCFSEFWGLEMLKRELDLYSNYYYMNFVVGSRN